MLVLGLSNMRDAAAALVRDGRILAAAEEERFVRIKHVTALPVNAIRYCLGEGGVRLADVDGIAVPWKYWVLGRRAALALGAMVRSPTLFRVKGRRGLERLGHEWTELALLAPKLRKRCGGGRYRPRVLGPHLCEPADSVVVSSVDRPGVLGVD